VLEDHGDHVEFVPDVFCFGEKGSFFTDIEEGVDEGRVSIDAVVGGYVDDLRVASLALVPQPLRRGFGRVVELLE